MKFQHTISIFFVPFIDLLFCYSGIGISELPAAVESQMSSTRSTARITPICWFQIWFSLASF